MNKNILSSKVQEFINQNLFQDFFKIVLKGSPFSDISTQELANQIASKEKAKKKLPTWFTAKDIYYPNKVSIEQTSSEITAFFKSQLVTGARIIDVTGGFGVDAYYFSKVFSEVVHCELQEDLSRIVEHNCKMLGINNVKTIAADGLQYLQQASLQFDCIYIDPSRRDDNNNKVFFLKDCLPNVCGHLELFFLKTETVLIKTSPILDITAALHDLNYVQTIFIVALENEVKELLFLLKKDYEGSVTIKTVNLQKNTSQLFNFQYNCSCVVRYSNPLSYLYEPNVAILKSGGFDAVSMQLGVYKLQQHSHLYTSEQIIDFPGRVFRIHAVYSYDIKIIKKHISLVKANITTRNFPLSVQQIRKATKIKDGGSDYLFFTKNMEEKLIVIWCRKPF